MCVHQLVIDHKEIGERREGEIETRRAGGRRKEGKEKGRERGRRKEGQREEEREGEREGRGRREGERKGDFGGKFSLFNSDVISGSNMPLWFSTSQGINSLLDFMSL